ncbi:AMP-binding protein [Brachybacterium sp. DNPG3]
MRLLQAGTALRLRAAVRPGSVILTDVRGELTARDLFDQVQLFARRGTRPPHLSELPADAPLRTVLVTALADGGRISLRSSGTTGAPHSQERGPLSAAQLRTLADLARRIGLRGGARVAVAAPGVHGHGLLLALGSLGLGAPLIDLSHLGADERVTLLHRTSPTILSGVPVHLSDLLQADRELGGNRTLRIPRIVSGSDVLSEELRADLARHWRARVHDVYGATETGTISVDGVPLRGVRVRAEDGLLRVRSPFTAGSWVTTDRGRLEPDGRIVVEGRADGRISSGGMLHDPRAVVRLLRMQPGIEQVSLRMLPDARFGRRTVAEVRVARGTTVTPDGLRALVRDRLGAASVPREVILHGGGPSEEISSRGR